MSYLQQHRKTKAKIISHEQLLIQVGNLERQCSLAGRTPDGRAWDLVSIPSCITVRDLARTFCVCLVMSKCSQSLPSLFFHRYDMKVSQKAARLSQKDINEQKGVLVLKCYLKILLFLNSKCSVSTAGGQLVCLWLLTSLVMVTLAQV